MKFLIVGGFLGSGKTSVILELAKHMVNVRGVERVAILENEIGQVGVDDKVLRGSGYQVTGMFSGCVCCTMAGELPGNVRLLQRDYDPEWIIMEATGMAFPGSIRENLEHTLGIRPQVLCIADAQRWRRLSGPLAHLLTPQLAGADRILINKADLAQQEELDKALADIQKIGGRAEIVCTSTQRGIPGEVFDRIMDWEGWA